MDPTAIVSEVSALVARLDEARAASLRIGERVTLYRHFGQGRQGVHLSAEWFAEGGRLYLKRRGRAVGRLAGRVVREFVPKEVSTERAARLLLRLGVPVDRLRTTPAVQMDPRL